MEAILQKFKDILSHLSEEELTDLQDSLDKTFTPEKLQTNPKISLKTGYTKGYEQDPGDYVSIYLRLDN